ncbi:MAG: CAP domain-containing protein [Propionicimonas sp.]
MTSVNPSDPVQYAAQIVRGTNDVRRAKGLPQLGGSVCARDAALKRAKALIGKTELTHTPLNAVIAGCAPATTAAENLSKAAAGPTAVIDAWMHSPGHRSNLLDPALTEIGVGCVMDGKPMLCSQVFLGP